MRLIGMDRLSFSGEHRAEKRSEGKVMVQRARVEKERSYNNYNRSHLGKELANRDPRKL